MENNQNRANYKRKLGGEVTFSGSTKYATLDHVLIDKQSGTCRAGSTDLPPTLKEQKSPNRGLNATKLLVSKDKTLSEFTDQLPESLNEIFDKRMSDSSFEKGHLYLYINCSFQDSMVGEIHQPLEINFNSIWDQLKNQISPDNLSDELEELINRLAKLAAESSNYQEISKVATAREELKKANAPGMLKYLKKAGNWVWDEVKKGGLPFLLQVYQLLSQSAGPN